MIVSLLGPQGMRNQSLCTTWYRNIMNLIRGHNIKRILAPCAATANQEGDNFHLVAWILVVIARVVVFQDLWATARSIERVFVEEGEGVDWTVFRVGHLEGGGDEESWKVGREDKIYIESVGDKRWVIGTGRAALAKWLVGCADGQDNWVRKMPAVSKTSGRMKSA
jgi:hypothetical protein